MCFTTQTISFGSVSTDVSPLRQGVKHVVSRLTVTKISKLFTNFTRYTYIINDLPFSAFQCTHSRKAHIFMPYRALSCVYRGVWVTLTKSYTRVDMGVLKLSKGCAAFSTHRCRSGHPPLSEVRMGVLSTSKIPGYSMIILSYHEQCNECLNFI